MASVETRQGSSGDTFRVVWRQDGAKQTERFEDAGQAEQFRRMVEAAGNRWPYGWVPGAGFEAPRSTAPTFREWAARAVAARTRANDRTKADYLAQLDKHVFPVLGDLRLDEIGREDVARWMGSVARSPKTVQNLHAMCSSIMLDAVAEQLCARNPFAGARQDIASVRVEEMVFLSSGEFAQLLGHVSPYYRPLVTLLGGTGLRWGEATALQVADLDILSTRKTLTVVRAWKRNDRSEFVLGEPKTRRSRRTIAIGAEVVEAVLPLWSGRDGAEFLFTTAVNGQPVRHSNFFNRVWNPAVARASVCAAHLEEQAKEAKDRKVRFSVPKPCGCAGTLTKRPRIHDLRHSHISWLIAAGVPLPAIQRRAGHSSITTTIDRYGHLAPEMDDQINAAVDSALLRV